MESKELFELAERLDKEIALLEKNVNSYEQRCELSDLKAYRVHVQEGIENLVSQAENQVNEGGY